MSDVYPQVTYTDNDSPPDSELTVPTMTIIDYLASVIDVIRRENTIYALFPTTHLIETALDGDGNIWAFDADGHYHNSDIPCWTRTNTTFDYPGWTACDVSPVSAETGTIDTVTQEDVTTVLYGEVKHTTWPTLPGWDICLSYYYTPSKGIDQIDKFWIQTHTRTEWRVFSQTVIDADEIVILIPIMVALMIPFSLLLTMNSETNTSIHDNRRRARR